MRLDNLYNLPNLRENIIKQKAASLQVSLKKEFGFNTDASQPTAATGHQRTPRARAQILYTPTISDEEQEYEPKFYLLSKWLPPLRLINTARAIQSNRNFTVVLTDKNQGPALMETEDYNYRVWKNHLSKTGTFRTTRL